MGRTKAWVRGLSSAAVLAALPCLGACGSDETDSEAEAPTRTASSASAPSNEQPSESSSSVAAEASNAPSADAASSSRQDADEWCSQVLDGHAVAALADKLDDPRATVHAGTYTPASQLLPGEEGAFTCDGVAMLSVVGFLNSEKAAEEFVARASAPLGAGTATSFGDVAATTWFSTADTARNSGGVMDWVIARDGVKVVAVTGTLRLTNPMPLEELHAAMAEVTPRLMEVELPNK